MELTQDLLKIIAVLGLLALTLWWLRKRGLARITLPGQRKAAEEKRLEVLDRLPLTAQHSLHLVRCVDRVILIAVSPSGCQLLEQAPGALPPAGGQR
jgi:flagellar biogenesis protein FliO